MKTHNPPTSSSPLRSKAAALPHEESEEAMDQQGKSLIPPSLQLSAQPVPPPVQRQSIAQLEDGKDGDKEEGTKLDGKASINLPRSTFEYNYEFAKKGNLSGSIRITGSPKGSKAIEGEVGYGKKHEDGTDFEPNVKSKVGLLENKTSFKKSHGQKTGLEMATALAKVDILEVSPFNWLKVSFDMKVFEAKFKANAEKGEEFDVALAKISGNIKGTPPPTWLASIGIPQEIIDKYSLSISGKIEYKVPFEDLAKLKQMHKASREVVKQTQELAKKAKAKDLLETRKRAVSKEIKQLQARKNALNHGGAKGMPRKDRLELNRELKDQISKLKGERREAKKKIDTLTTAIKKHKNIISKSDDLMRSAAKGLKSRSGRLMGKTIQKVGGKIAGKIIAKLIPGLNILSTIVDVIEVSVMLYKLFDGQITFGIGGGGESGGEKGETEGEGGAGQEDSPATKEAEGGQKEGTGEGSGEGKKEGTESQEGEGKTDTSTEAGIPDFDKIDPDDASLYEPVSDPHEQVGKPPSLTPQAKALIEALKASGDSKEEATRMTNEALHQLNESIPTDLSDEELQELINRMQGQGNPAEADPDALIGRVMATVDDIRTGAPVSDQIEEVKAIDYASAGIANKNWQNTLGWTVEELSGQSYAVDSKELVDYLAAFQASNGINGGGIAGPKTVIAILTKLGKTDSPAYAKAKESLAQKSSDERVESAASGSEKGGEGKAEGGLEGAGEAENATDTSTDSDTAPKVEENTKVEDTSKVEGGETEGTEAEGSEEKQPEVVNDRPEVFNSEVMISCLSLDAKTKVVTVNQKKVKEIQALGKTDSYGMDVTINSFSLQAKPIEVGGEVKYYRITGSMGFDVTALPSNAGEQYPYEAGKNYTEYIDMGYDIERDRFKQVYQTQYAQILSGLLEANGDAAKLRPGVAGSERDLKEFKATISGITSQHSLPKEGGGNAYIVEIEVVPTDLKTFTGILLDGKLIPLEVGKAISIKTQLIPETTPAK